MVDQKIAMLHNMATQTTISREVRRFGAALDLNTSKLAEALGYSRSALNDRLRGRTRWHADDIDRLRDAGVPLELTAYDITEAATR